VASDGRLETLHIYCEYLNNKKLCLCKTLKKTLAKDKTFPIWNQKVQNLSVMYQHLSF
jgi:hypothetical protein